MMDNNIPTQYRGLVEAMDIFDKYCDGDWYAESLTNADSFHQGVKIVGVDPNIISDKDQDALRRFHFYYDPNIDYIICTIDIYPLDFLNVLKFMRSNPSAVSIRITCPTCGEYHIDEGEFETKPHHTHSCQSCGLTWRPAVQYTRGVKFLPGFKN